MGRWSLDHLFLDQDGIPTLVEVKRGTDTRIRREVVGQMLDYAANAILHWPLATLRARFGAQCQDDGRDPDEVIAGLIGTGADREAFWAGVGANLQAGRIRLLFVADRIPPELRRVVEFLNRQMQPAEVLAVELRQYEGQGLKTLVPLVLGQTQEATAKKGGALRGPQPKRLWDGPAIVAEIETKHGPEIARVADAIFAWCRDRADEVRFTDRQDWGWFTPVFRRDGADYVPFRVWTDGSIAITFQYLLETPLYGPDAPRRALFDRLNALPGVKLPDSALTRRKHVPLQVLAEGAALAAFLAVMDGFVASLQASGAGRGTTANFATEHGEQ